MVRVAHTGDGVTLGSPMPVFFVHTALAVKWLCDFPHTERHYKEGRLGRGEILCKVVMVFVLGECPLFLAFSP